MGGHIVPSKFFILQSVDQIGMVIFCQRLLSSLNLVPVDFNHI